jgi:WD40 repeat protein
MAIGPNIVVFDSALLQSGVVRPEFTLSGHSSTVEGLCMLPDGRLVSAANDSTLRVWDLDSKAVVHTVQAGSSQKRVIFVDRAGEPHVASCGGNRTHLWKVSDWTKVREFSFGSGTIGGLAQTQDKKLVIASYDHHCRVIDVEDPSFPVCVFLSAVSQCVRGRVFAWADHRGLQWTRQRCQLCGRGE